MRLLLATLLVSSAPELLHATEKPQDDIIAVTGTRLPGPETQLPAVVKIVSRVDLRQMNYDNLVDILRTVAGVHVSQSGGRGGPASIFVRGGDPNFTLILLDGIRVNDLNSSRGGTFDLASIDVDSIERVEIIKGARSAVYGSDALSGVINIITRAPADSYQAVAAVEAGTQGYRSARLDFSAPLSDAGGVSLGIGGLDVGHSVTGSRFDSHEAIGRVRLDGADKWTFDLVGRYAQSNSMTFPDDSGGPRLAVSRELRVEGADDFTIRGSARGLLSQRLTVNLTGGTYRRTANQTTPEIPAATRPFVPASADRTELARDSASVYVTSSIGQRGQALLGGDVIRERGDSEGFVQVAPGFRLPASYEIDRTVKGVFSEYRHQSKIGVTLVAGLRADFPGDESRQTNRNLGLSYSLRDGNSRIYVNWGEGFKLPSFFALANPIVGNNELVPEESASFELGIQRYFQDETIDIAVSLFRQSFTNLIDFDPIQFRLVNRAKVETKGVELNVGLHPTEKTTILGHATYITFDLPGSDVTLRHRPEWRGGLSYRWIPADSLSLVLSWLYVDDSIDSSIPTGEVILPDNHRIDAALVWRAASRLEYRLSVDNVLDSDHEESVGFPVPGIRTRFSIRYRFGGADDSG